MLNNLYIDYMPTLKEFDNARYEKWNKLNNRSKKKNGIECPKCKSELYDSSPMITLASNPPRKNIHCESCDFVGYRIA